MNNTISKSAFARLQQFSAPYVSKLAKQGRLVLDENGQVLVAESIARIKQTADPAAQHVAERHALNKGYQPAAPIEYKPTEHKNTGITADDFHLARARRETHEANMAELKEQKIRGELVEALAVKRAITGNAVATRQALERLPDRLSTMLAAETDPAKIHALLTQELDEVCSNIADAAVAAIEANQQEK